MGVLYGAETVISSNVSWFIALNFLFYSTATYFGKLGLNNVVQNKYFDIGIFETLASINQEKFKLLIQKKHKYFLICKFIDFKLT